MDELILALQGLKLVMQFEDQIQEAIDLAVAGDRKGAEVALGQVLGQFYQQAVTAGLDMAADMLEEKLRAAGRL